MRRSSHRLGIVLLPIILSSANAWSEELPSEQDYFLEFPVVLSASRLSQPLSEAPNAMTVIDRKMIKASGFRTIPDLFKLVPGMYVSYYKGSQGFVSYHGSTDQYARRMQVMIDGRSVYLPPVSTVDWSNLPITVDDIERIEVVRGPAAASHGANSTQGVISIITREAGAMDGKSVSVTHGNKGINDVSARFGKRGEKFDYRMTLAYMSDDGYDALGSLPNGIPITQSQASGLLNNANDSNRAQLMNFRGDYHPNAIDRFDIQFGFTHDVQGVGFNDRDASTNRNTFHDLDADAGFLQLGWTRVFSPDSELNLRYYHIQQSQFESLPAYVSGVFKPGPITQSLKVRRDELEAQHTLQISAGNRLVYGAAYRRDLTEAWGNIPSSIPPTGNPYSYSSSLETDEWRIFAHDEWRITPRLLLNTGGMFECDATGHQNLSPRVALNFHVSPQHTLRAGTSVAYRTPSVVEERYPLGRYASMPAADRIFYLPGALFISDQTVTSPGLRPERLVSREIGYLGELPGGATSLDLRIFSDSLDDGIFIDKTVHFSNGLSAEYRGLEATLKHSFSRDSDLTVNFAHELASSNGPALVALGHTELTSDHPTNKDILSASTPQNNLSLLYSQRLQDRISFSAAYYHQDALQPFDRGKIDYQPIQNRTDVRIAKGFSPAGGFAGEMALVVQNVFGKDYTEYIASNVFNRRAWLTLTLDW